MITQSLIIGAGSIAAIVAATFALPSSSVVTRSRVVAARPDAIFALLKSSADFQRFNPYKDTDPNLAISLFGPDQGIGSGFAFRGKEGSGTQTIVALEPDRSATMQIDMGFIGKPVLTLKLQPQAGGTEVTRTEVTWQMESHFGFNPMGRVFGLFLEKMLGPIAERGLANLARAVGG